MAHDFDLGNLEEVRERMRRASTFEVTQDHLKLLRRLNVDWDYDHRVPSFDIKRPYGNKDVVEDIARILEWEVFVDYDGEKHLSKDQYERANQLHLQMEQVLQIFICMGNLTPGVYSKSEFYDQHSWAPIM